MLNSKGQVRTSEMLSACFVSNHFQMISPILAVYEFTTRNLTSMVIVQSCSNDLLFM